MTVKELIEALSQYPEDAEIVNIEVDDWQSFLNQNMWCAKFERLYVKESRDANMIIVNPD